jgi:hypothetical protein
MGNLLISLPEQLATRIRATIPNRQRSKTIAALIEQEVIRREQLLLACAMEVEKDQSLHEDMKVWESTLQDGLSDESW